MRFAGIETHQIRRRAPLVEDFCISYTTSSKKIKFVKIIKQSYEFNTESQKTRRPVSPPSVSGGPCLDVVQKEIPRPKKRFHEKTTIYFTCSQDVRNPANQNRTDWPPKGAEAAPNANQSEPKQNRMEAKGGRSRTEQEPKWTEAEPNKNPGVTEAEPNGNQREAKPNRLRTKTNRNRTE